MKQVREDERRWGERERGTVLGSFTMQNDNNTKTKVGELNALC